MTRPAWEFKIEQISYGFWREAVRGIRIYAGSDTNKVKSRSLTIQHSHRRAVDRFMLRWNDIKDLKSSVVTYNCMDYTHPGGPQKRITAFHAPLINVSGKKITAKHENSLKGSKAHGGCGAFPSLNALNQPLKLT